MYTSLRETREINQSLGNIDLGFWMCPFSVSIHIQYTRITILVAHPLKNWSSCHVCCLSPHRVITSGTTRITADVCHFGFEPKFNYSLSDKIPLRMHHNPNCVLQTLKFPQYSTAPAFRCFLPFTSKYFLCECFCHLSTHIHHINILTNSTRFRIQNIRLDTQHWYFTVAWQTEFEECIDVLREVSPCSFHITLSV